MKKIYKVIYNNNGKLMSCMIGNPRLFTPDEKWLKDWRVEYRLNKWIKPLQLNTLLFVFTTLLYAQKFCDTVLSDITKGFEIYGGVAKNLSKTPKVPLYFTAQNFIDFWDKDLNHLALPSLPAWAGTRLVSEVKLLKLCPKKGGLL